MMLHFFDYLKETDPDLMTAWFGDLFDFPYLVNRVSRIGLDVDSLGRLSGTRAEMFGNRLITTIRGRALLDLYWGYRYIIFTGRESWSLDYIAKYEKLGLKKIEYEGAIDDLWEKDIDAVMEYNQMDVEIIVALDKKMNIINFFDSLRRMTVCNWNNLFARSQMHDLHILKWCHNHGIVLPCKPEYVEGASDESFQGALVLDPIKGLHEQIFVFDLKSFYLSMAVSCNMSYETISSDGEIKLGNGICFKKEPKGIIPSVVEDLFNLRNSYKALKSAAPYGSSEWKKYDMLQYCVKMLTASLYGAIAYPRFRLNKKEISSTITWLGREILTHTKKILEENGCIVITGDTDSILFKLKEPKSSDEAVKEGVRLLEIINGSYSDFVKQWGIDKHIIQIDFEKIFSTGLFLTKKRYAGKICWSGGKFVDDWDIKGMESKRSDTPHLVGEKQKEIVHSILNKESKESVISSLKLFINYLKNECAIEDIAMPTGITKMPELYGKNGKGVPAHVRACLYANKLHRANITGGVKVKWLYVVPKVRVDNKRVDVIAFTNKMHSGYEVDWEKMLNRLVYMKFDGIFSALGWDVRALSGQQTLEGFK
jgi:DNA polymerase I